VPVGAVHGTAITKKYYGELTPMQRMNSTWNLDNDATWDAFFINRRERELVRYEGDDPPPVP